MIARDIGYLPSEVCIELAAEQRRREDEYLEKRWALRALEREAWKLYEKEFEEWHKLRRAGVVTQRPRPPAPVRLPRFHTAMPIRRDPTAERVSWPSWLGASGAEAYIRRLRRASGVD